MQISQRAGVDGVECDVVCTGRFYDFFARRDGRWAIARRRAIYEKDRLDPVDPSKTMHLDKSLLDSFPSGYRHLAYLQTRIGYQVRGEKRAELKGPAVEALYAQGRDWLAGKPLR